MLATAQKSGDFNSAGCRLMTTACESELLNRMEYHVVWSAEPGRTVGRLLCGKDLQYIK